MRSDLQQTLVDRFLRYVAIPSQSDASKTVVPTSQGQWDLARLLEKELIEMGLEDVFLSEYCVLTAKLPSNSTKKLPKVGLCAHLDTVDVNLSPEIYPHIVDYQGGDICLNQEDQIYIKLDEHPELNEYVGQEILVTNGHSVLGADDKAAISAMMTALHFYQSNPEVPHGDIYIAFLPDEEIGLRGAKKMDFKRFPVDFAYTLDCCGIGEVVYETFNAASAFVHIKGVSAHPMSAKGVLLNPTLVATDFVQFFNRLETPENTEGREGYIWIQSIQSNQSTADVEINIRDHSLVGYEARKQYIYDAVEFLKKRYPRADISLKIEDVYGNIKDALTQENQSCIDYVYRAMEILGITPKTLAMRGGTDGSHISKQGIPTPNFFTGAHNFHANTEFLPLNSFEKSCQMIFTIMQLIVEDFE